MNPICSLWFLLVSFLFLSITSCSSHADGAPPAVNLPTPQTLSVPDAGSLQALLKYSGELLPIVSAHRGGSGDRLPENCIATFEATIQKTFALIEVDPRLTRDGVIVLHHDATLDRTTTGRGPLNALTCEEIRRLKLKDPQGQVTDYVIPTLDEALEWARGKAVLVLDQKDVSVEARVRKVTEHHAESYALLIVYSFEAAGECYRLNPDIMMEVMIPSLEKLKAFERTGIPWRNVIAFIGHEPPPYDTRLIQQLHERGVCCLAGTSRHLDRQFLHRQVDGIEQLRGDYLSLSDAGVDLIETDIPRELAPVLFKTVKVPDSKKSYFLKPVR